MNGKEFTWESVAKNPATGYFDDPKKNAGY